MTQMYLTDEEKAMLAGEYGSGKKRAMEILVKIGETFGAEKMVKIKSAHVMPKEPIELLNELTDGVNENGVPICTHHALMSAFDPECWERMGIPEDYANLELEVRAKRLDVYNRIGFYQTNTCLPMLVGNLPLKGDHISWIGSGAQLLVNSLIGARTNRDGTVVNLAAAITGRVPCMGLHLDENRYAKVLVKIEQEKNIKELTFTDLGAIGYYVGAIAQDRNIVVNGLPRDLGLDQLKHLMAPLSASGSVSICHINGLTPEAATLDQALGGKEPEEVITVTKENIKETKLKFTLGNNEKIDLVIFGCPHCSTDEVKDYAKILENSEIINGRRLWIGMPYMQYELAKKMGYTDIVENAGGVFASACMATIPDHPLPEDVKIVATNSFKAAHYIKAFTKGKVKVVVMDAAECINSICN